MSFDETLKDRGAPGRVVCLDTETTGLSPSHDRIVQIACVELHQGVTLGKRRSWLLNPGIAIPSEATSVHGITNAMVAGAPTFPEIAEDLRMFIGTSPIVAHNASFDMAFLREEMGRTGLSPLPNEVVDTLPMVRRVVGTGRATLDAACKLFGISLDRRKDRHDALVDAELLAEVFGFLIGARKRTLFDDLGMATATVAASARKPKTPNPTLAPTSYPDRGLGAPRDDERAAHTQWRHHFGLALTLLAIVLGGCVPTESIHTTTPIQSPQAEANPATRVEIRDEAKDLTTEDRVVRAAQQTPSTPLEPHEPRRTPTEEARPSQTLQRQGSAQQDIVDARALAVLSALLGGVPTSTLIEPPHQQAGGSTPPTGVSPILHLIPRE